MLPPTKINMTRDECKKYLRFLELDAYANMVSVLRAQGTFTPDKRKLLLELANVLHISNERHRAEIRRAVNDDKLSMVAEQLNGSNTGTDWAIEGRRTIPLLPRLKARTPFTTLANSLSIATAIANEKEPKPIEKIEDFEVKVETEACMPDIDVKVPISSHESKYISRKRKRSVQEVVEVKKIAGKSSVKQRNSEIEQIFNSTENNRLLPSTSTDNIVQRQPDLTVDPLRRKESEKSNLENSETSSLLSDISEGKKITVFPSNQNTSTDNSEGKYISTSTSKSSETRSDTLNISVASSIATNVTDSVQNKIIHTTHAVTNMAPTLLPNGSQSPLRINTQVLLQDVKNNSNKALKLVPVTISNNGAKVLNTESGSPMPYVKKIVSISPANTASPTIDKLGKPVTRVVTVTSGCASFVGTHSSSPSTIINKKLPPVCMKLGNHATPKLDLTGSASKTLNLTQSGTKLASKGNVFVVQKGSARGVTLSHAGKEVVGKVIMGGKHFCLANQQIPNSVALIPNLIPTSNGDQAVAKLLSSSNTASKGIIKANVKAKANNMIVFDLRQEVALENNQASSQFFDNANICDAKSVTSENVPSAVTNNNDSGTSQESSMHDIMSETRVTQNPNTIEAEMVADKLPLHCDKNEDARKCTENSAEKNTGTIIQTNVVNHQSPGVSDVSRSENQGTTELNVNFDQFCNPSSSVDKLESSENVLLHDKKDCVFPSHCDTSQVVKKD